MRRRRMRSCEGAAVPRTRGGGRGKYYDSKQRETVMDRRERHAAAFPLYKSPPVLTCWKIGRGAKWPWICRRKLRADFFARSSFLPTRRAPSATLRCVEREWEDLARVMGFSMRFCSNNGVHCACNLDGKLNGDVVLSKTECFNLTCSFSWANRARGGFNKWKRQKLSNQVQWPLNNLGISF